MSTDDNNESTIPSNLQALGASIGTHIDESHSEEPQAPGFVRRMPELIQELWSKKVYFNLNEKGELKLNGFYKGNIRLLINNDDTIEALDKNNQKTIIHNFDDLALLNYKWWTLSNTKNSYAIPDKPWIDYFAEKDWVERRVIYLPKHNA